MLEEKEKRTSLEKAKEILSEQYPFLKNLTNELRKKILGEEEQVVRDIREDNLKKIQEPAKLLEIGKQYMTLTFDEEAQKYFRGCIEGIKKGSTKVEEVGLLVQAYRMLGESLLVESSINYAKSGEAIECINNALNLINTSGKIMKEEEAYCYDVEGQLSGYHND